MENETENLDSPNETESTEPENDANQGNLDALKEQLKETSDKNRQLFERAKKAEAELKEFRAKAEAKPESQPTAPDYGRLAFLQTKGIDHPDDIKMVESEAERLKLPLTDVLGMPHVQAQLTALRDERTAKEGLPHGTGKAGGNQKGTLEYWLAQGEGKVPTTPDGNIDQELAEKVVEARIKKEKSDAQFAPIW